MDDLLEGKIEPAALSALSRSARVLVDLYRLADEEMALIRDEEAATAAAQILGGRGNTDLLDKADTIAAWQIQYRIDALIAQGFVTLDSEDGHGSDQAPAPVLTTAGRQRFRYQRLTKYTQKDVDVWREIVTPASKDIDELSAALTQLYCIRTALEDALTDFAPDSDPVLDPLTGQPLLQLPHGVKPATVPVAGPAQSHQAAKEMQDLLRRASELNRDVEELFEKCFGHPFDIRAELEEEDE